MAINNIHPVIAIVIPANAIFPYDIGNHNINKLYNTYDNNVYKGINLYFNDNGKN